MVKDPLISEKAFGHLLDFFQTVLLKTSQVPPDKGIVKYFEILFCSNGTDFQRPGNGGLVDDRSGVIRQALNKKPEVVRVEPGKKPLDIPSDMVSKILIHPESMKK